MGMELLETNGVTMFKYDANTGEVPQLNDYVEVSGSGSSDLDGLKGKIGGWGDHAKMIALIIYDKPLSDGSRVSGWPVVCLKKVEEYPNKLHPSHKSVRSSDASTFDFICDDCGSHDQVPGGWGSLSKPCEGKSQIDFVVDSDGYTIWNGGKFCPVHKDTLILIKLRNGQVSNRARCANEWSSIRWFHRNKNDEMNKWDIVAYKILPTE
jgi:hypothetical protein